MREKLTGLGILALAVALAWGVVAFVQARGGDWVVALIGTERAGADAAMVETLFNLMVFTPLVLIALGAAAAERRNAAALGRRRMALIGLVVGLAGLSICVLYARLAGSLSLGQAGGATAAMLIWGMALIAFQTAAEEVYFRGWLQPALVSRWGAAGGIAAAALAFAALHVAGGARAPVSLLNLVLGGLMFGLLAWRGGGVAGALGLHFAWNASEQLLYGVDPNPGVGGFGAVWDWELIGRPIWGGSEDGLNGSIGMTIVLLAILLPLALYRRPPPPEPLTR